MNILGDTYLCAKYKPQTTQSKASEDTNDNQRIKSEAVRHG